MVDLCDMTLREGDQMPGRSYSVEQKVEAGMALDRLGLTAMQAGFPVTGEKDRETIRRLVGRVDADVVALSRAIDGDVDAALDAEADVVEVIIPTSQSHLDHVLGKSRAETIEMARDAVDRVRDGGATAHLALVDGFRTDPADLAATFEAFPDLPMITIADTVGARTPDRVSGMLADLADRGVDHDRLGVHFHDDLGVATANTLAAARAGAAKADVSVASLGERAGNAALEEVVVADAVDGDGAFDVDRAELVPACLDVLETLCESVEPRKPVLGSEVTEHEAGLHTAAMLDDPATFEPFDPADFGGERTLVFGEGSGRGSARKLLEREGVAVTDDTVAALLDLLADRGPMDAEAAVSLARDEL
ncbi:MAG: LeuA family protein [Haloplanus sp.]